MAANKIIRVPYFKEQNEYHTYWKERLELLPPGSLKKAVTKEVFGEFSDAVVHRENNNGKLPPGYRKRCEDLSKGRVYLPGPGSIGNYYSDGVDDRGEVIIKSEQSDKRILDVNDFLQSGNHHFPQAYNNSKELAAEMSSIGLTGISAETLKFIKWNGPPGQADSYLDYDEAQEEYRVKPIPEGYSVVYFIAKGPSSSDEDDPALLICGRKPKADSFEDEDTSEDDDKENRSVGDKDEDSDDDEDDDLGPDQGRQIVRRRASEEEEDEVEVEEYHPPPETVVRDIVRGSGCSPAQVDKALALLDRQQSSLEEEQSLAMQRTTGELQLAHRRQLSIEKGQELLSDIVGSSGGKGSQFSRIGPPGSPVMAPKRLKMTPHKAGGPAKMATPAFNRGGRPPRVPGSRTSSVASTPQKMAAKPKAATSTPKKMPAKTKFKRPAKDTKLTPAQKKKKKEQEAITPTPSKPSATKPLTEAEKAEASARAKAWAAEDDRRRAGLQNNVARSRAMGVARRPTPQKDEDGDDSPPAVRRSGRNRKPSKK